MFSTVKVWYSLATLSKGYVVCSGVRYSNGEVKLVSVVLSSKGMVRY